MNTLQLTYKSSISVSVLSYLQLIPDLMQIEILHLEIDRHAHPPESILLHSFC